MTDERPEINRDLAAMRKAAEDLRARCREKQLERFGMWEEAEKVAQNVFRGSGEKNPMIYFQFVKDLALLLYKERKERAEFDKGLRAWAEIESQK